MVIGFGLSASLIALNAFFFDNLKTQKYKSSTKEINENPMNSPKSPPQLARNSVIP